MGEFLRNTFIAIGADESAALSTTLLTKEKAPQSYSTARYAFVSSGYVANAENNRYMIPESLLNH
jgi:hypothetical protein